MRRLINNIAIQVLGSGGVAKELHRVGWPKTLTIVMYHGVVREPLRVSDWCFLSEETFREQVEYLTQHFEVLPLHEAARRLGAGELERPTAAVTFDDGYANTHDVAWPILRELGVPATVFLNTDLIGSDRALWFCRLNAAVTSAMGDPRRQVLSWDGMIYALSTPEDASGSLGGLQERLKALRGAEFEAAVEEVLEKLGWGGERPVAPDSPFRMLPEAQVRAMAESGTVEFGAHTATHTILAGLPEAEARDEIVRSIERTAELSGRPCRLFAYPNGRREDYNEQSMKILREAGIEYAVTTREGANTRETAPLELLRYGIGPDEPGAVFRMSVHHVRQWLKESAAKRVLWDLPRQAVGWVVHSPRRYRRWALRKQQRRAYEQRVASGDWPRGPEARILFLCYGNICRSPFAAHYLAARLAERGLAGPRCESAGFYRKSGRPTPRRIRSMVREFGVDLEVHRSQCLDRPMVMGADLVVVMDLKNLEDLRSMFPQVMSKTIMLGLLSPGDPCEIADPYNLDRTGAIESYEHLVRALDGLAEHLVRRAGGADGQSGAPRGDGGRSEGSDSLDSASAMR